MGGVEHVTFPVVHFGEHWHSPPMMKNASAPERFFGEKDRARHQSRSAVAKVSETGRRGKFGIAVGSSIHPSDNIVSAYCFAKPLTVE